MRFVEFVVIGIYITQLANFFLLATISNKMSDILKKEGRK